MLVLPASVVGFAFCGRLLVAAGWPTVSGDWIIYSKVARNILWNGCVSLSDPSAGLCEPHWGGNQLPGFPFFVAALWRVFPEAWLPIAVGHCLVFAVAAGYLLWSINRWCEDRALCLAAVLLVALSPLTVPWARFTLTETLALAANVWILAELVRSFADRSLRVMPLAVACAVAIFIRYDNALVAVPIAVSGFLLHRPGEAIRRGLALALLVSLPLGLWMARSVAQGLGPLPDLYFSALGHPMPKGYLAWGKTWATTQYEARGWFYAVHTGEYSGIRLPETAYHEPAQRARIDALIAELARHDGRSFPAAIDRSFARIAAERCAAVPFDCAVNLPLQRIWNILWNPRNSGGWPVSLGVGVGTPPPVDLVATALAHPIAAVVKVGTSAYRLALFVGVTCLALWAVLAGWRGPPVVVLWMAASYAVARVAFMGWGFFMESRYLLEAVPFLEVALVLTLGTWWKRRARTNATSGHAR